MFMYVCISFAVIQDVDSLRKTSSIKYKPKQLVKYL